MSLLDEVKAASSRKGSRCALCEWLASLPDDEAGEWQEVFEAPLIEVQHTAIERVLNNHGHDFTTSQVENHRRKHVWKNRDKA